ncbi:MAG: peptide chain release factor N(5)-glutamine methyltransferase [Bacteroidota bacterium]
MGNIKDIWKQTAKRLEKVYTPGEAEAISFTLLIDVYGMTREDILLNEGSPIDGVHLETLVTRLMDFEPIQYVTQTAYFYNRQFKVDPSVLIPRPETEELVQLVIQQDLNDGSRILDVGAGSGCIAITLGLETRGKVQATDVSKDALDIAIHNAKVYKADVTFHLHDILKGGFVSNSFDVLVSNPPYIPEADRSIMHKNVLHHEPELALFVPDEDALLFYRRLAKVGTESLTDGGKIFLEIHENFGEDVGDLLQRYNYTSVQIHKDMQGKQRIASAIWNS